MSLSLITNPVVTESGVKKNIFPGFRPVEYVFKREDLAITSVGSGVDNNILITIGTDLTTYLEMGDFIYLYATGNSGTYEYDLTGKITTITSTEITIDSQYIEAASSGYINYLINYNVEIELVGAENVNRKVIPFSLKDDGDQAGNISIDVSIANDKNKQLFELITGEQTEGRVKLDVRYREVSLGVTGSWVLLNDPVILIYAWSQMAVEDIVTEFDLPKLYKGYDSGVIISHGDNGLINDNIYITYDELDINLNDVSTNNILSQIDIDFYGMLFYKFDKAISLDSSTKYIKFSGQYGNIPEYSASEYDATEYQTI